MDILFGELNVVGYNMILAVQKLNPMTARSQIFNGDAILILRIIVDIDAITSVTRLETN